MGTLEFCRDYKKKLKLEEEGNTASTLVCDDIPKVTMYVNWTSNLMSGPYVVGPHAGLVLDKEDLEYLYCKYKQVAEGELEAALQKFKADNANI